MEANISGLMDLCVKAVEIFTPFLWVGLMLIWISLITTNVHKKNKNDGKTETDGKTPLPLMAKILCISAVAVVSIGAAFAVIAAIAG